MSGSEPVPSDTAISQKLQQVVIALHKSGNNNELTVKRVRRRAESELGLEDGFLKAHPTWKAKSQKAIEDAVNTYCVSDSSPEPASKKATKVKPKPKPDPAESKSKKVAPSAGSKRKAATSAKKPKKRRKADSEDDMESELSEALDDDNVTPPPKRTTKPARRPNVAEDSDGAPAAAPSPKVQDNASDSDMSSLIDESPKPKPKPRQKKESTAKGKQAAATKAATPKVVDDHPDAAQVKQLQGWLVKCGIRKVWSKDPELAKCDTNTEKITVLKRMLKDIGMDGKYSVEKAAKIKEKREFQKDLAAIQEAEAHWGAADTGGRPRRRAAAAVKPQQKLVLSDDSEDHESGGDDNVSSEGADEDMDDDDDGAKGDSDDADDNSADDESD